MERENKLEYRERRKLLIMAICTVLVMAVSGYTIHWALSTRDQIAVDPVVEPPEDVTPIEDPVPPPPEIVVPLPELPAAFAVAVDNKFDARPHTGLEKADLVFEVLAEWRITRFLAFFYTQEVPVIGPVRSLRYYSAQIAAPFKTPYAHAGGSADGLQAIRDLRIPDLDEIYNSQPAFWRDRSRYAPHNLYTSTDLMLAEATRRGLKMTPLPEQATGIMSDGRPTESLSITYSVRNPSLYLIDYKAEWKWDGETYRRYMNGQPHVTTDDVHITAENLVVIKVTHRDHVTIADTYWRTEMDLIGSGEALFFREGVLYEGTWHKPTIHDHFEYMVNGQPYKFVPGNTWVQIVPGMDVVTIR